MPKSAVAVDQLNQLAAYQQQLDFTIEYVSPECWTLNSLRRELVEAQVGVRACDEDIDGVPADGTFDDAPKAHWELMAEVIGYVIDVRSNCRRLTEAELDVVEGLVG